MQPQASALATRWAKERTSSEGQPRACYAVPLIAEMLPAQVGLLKGTLGAVSWDTCAWVDRYRNKWHEAGRQASLLFAKEWQHSVTQLALCDPAVCSSMMQWTVMSRSGLRYKCVHRLAILVSGMLRYRKMEGLWPLETSESVKSCTQPNISEDQKRQNQQCQNLGSLMFVGYLLSS